jgi:hypothetical protein
MTLEVEKHVEVVLKSGGLTTEVDGLFREKCTIVLAFDAQGLADFSDLMTVVEVFDSLFEADGDEEPDDDGGDVDEEVAPGAGGMVGGVDVEHGGSMSLAF